MLEHRFAKVTACATFLLLLVGSTVNPTGSSLACPEAWFICRGTFFPKMVGGVLFEHGHRQVGTVVGLLQICVTVLLWRRRPSLRPLAVAALAMVCIQGSLGAATVHYQLPMAVSTGHLLLAFFYFATVLYLAYQTRPAAAPEPSPGARRLRGWIIAAALAVYAQIGLGALVRHSGGALACLDLPLCRGSLLPAGAGAPLVLHMLHRMMGVLVGLLVIATAVQVLRRGRAAGLPGWARAVAAGLPLLVGLQIALGLLSVYTFRAVPVVVAHTGTAALLWASLVVLWLAARLEQVSAGVEPEELRSAALAVRS